MMPLDFECGEALRQVKRGLDQLIQDFLPAERAANPEEREDRRHNTDYLIEQLRVTVSQILNDEGQLPPRGPAFEPLGPNDSTPCVS